MKKIGVYFLFAIFSTVEVKADEAVVIEVRKNIGMSKTDKIYKNYFINGGTALGLAKGSTVDVLRRVAVHDPLKNTSIGDIRVKVAQMEIIQADPRISVARVVSQESPENRPLLEYEAVMVGDRLDLGSIHLAKAAPTAALESIPGDKVARLTGESQSQKLVKEGDRMLASLEAKTPVQESSREPASHHKKAKKKHKAKHKKAKKKK